LGEKQVIKDQPLIKAGGVLRGRFSDANRCFWQCEALKEVQK